jgi:UDP-glucuronate 4-epimerase
MKIAIIGHLGFVGSHLTKYFDKQNISWVGYDLVSGQDIRDAHKLDRFFEENQISHVIHLANLAGVRRGNEYPEEYISTNILGTLNVVKMCEKYNVDHLIYYSSSSVYGEGNPPIVEIDNKNPKSLYGITKVAGELIVNSSKIEQTTILIPFTIYGGETESGCRKDSVIHKWIAQSKQGKPITVYGDGSSCRGFVYIDDIVDITSKILINQNRKWKHETFNIGGSEVIKLNDIINIFKDEIQTLARFQYLPMPDVDIKVNYADTSKAKRILGFDPKKMFKENLIKIIKKEFYELKNN